MKSDIGRYSVSARDAFESLTPTQLSFLLGLAAGHILPLRHRSGFLRRLHARGLIEPYEAAHGPHGMRVERWRVPGRVARRLAEHLSSADQEA